MKHKNFLRFLLIAICLALSNSCIDKIPPSSDSGNDAPMDRVVTLREYFESTSPALYQIKLGSSLCDHASTRSDSSSSWQTSNLVPDWDRAYTWDAYKRFYVEVPLKGDGIYRSSILKSGRHHRVYPARSFLVLISDKATGAINYHVVTTIVETHGRRKPTSEDFHYVGNSDFNGFLLFSRVDGTSIRSLHVRNHKVHPIHIGGSSVTSTRASSANSGSVEHGYTLSLTSSDVRYSYYESGGSDGEDNDFEDPIYCAICGKYYDLADGDCPNGCSVEIPSNPMELCGICWMYYDTSLYSSCPNGCSPFACVICGQDPCICYQVCERCGDPFCPGPWYCSSNDDCIGEKCYICGGYKTNTRSSSNCPICTCDSSPEVDEVYNVGLGVVPSTVDLGDNYTMSIINTSSTKATITKIDYHIMYPKDISTPLDLGTSSTTSKTVRAYRPGVWKLQATVQFSNGKIVKTEIQDITIQNPSYTKIMAAPTVITKMETLWRAAVSAATGISPSYKEKGCWILFNTENNVYEFIDVADSPEYVCEGTTNIEFPYPSLYPKHPNVGEKYVVGAFHTHPARTKCDNTRYYNVGPSDTDRAMGTVFFLYDYIATYKNVMIKGGHSPNDGYKLYHYGMGDNNSLGKERHPLNFLE